MNKLLKSLLVSAALLIGAGTFICVILGIALSDNSTTTTFAEGFTRQLTTIHDIWQWLLLLYLGVTVAIYLILRFR